MRRLFLLLLPVLLMFGGPAWAQQAAWQITEVSGEVAVVHEGRRSAARRGQLLAGGATLITAARARAVLVRGNDYTIVSPSSRIRIPDAAQQGRNPVLRMLADWGTALFRIERRQAPHFQVQTPYLAAVVKGTVFSVTVGGSGASVQVTEGAVEVSTADGGAAELVRPGNVAAVDAADLRQLTIDGENARTVRSAGTALPGVATVPVEERATPAAEPAGPAAEPSPAAGAAAESRDARAPAAAAEIGEPIATGPVSLAGVTGGLIEGTASVDIDAIVADTRRDNVADAGQSAPPPTDITGGSGPLPAIGLPAGVEDVGAGTGSELTGGAGAGGGASLPGNDAGDSGGGGGSTEGGSGAGGDDRAASNDDSGSSDGSGSGGGAAGSGSGSSGSDDDGAGSTGSGSGVGVCLPGDLLCVGLGGDDDDDSSGSGGSSGSDDGDDSSGSGSTDDDDGAAGTGDGGVGVCLPGDLLCVGLGGDNDGSSGSGGSSGSDDGDDSSGSGGSGSSDDDDDRTAGAGDGGDGVCLPGDLLCVGLGGDDDDDSSGSGGSSGSDDGDDSSGSGGSGSSDDDDDGSAGAGDGGVGVCLPGDLLCVGLGGDDDDDSSGSGGSSGSDDDDDSSGSGGSGSDDGSSGGSGSGSSDDDDDGSAGADDGGVDVCLPGDLLCVGLGGDDDDDDSSGTDSGSSDDDDSDSSGSGSGDDVSNSDEDDGGVDVCLPGDLLCVGLGRDDDGV